MQQKINNKADCFNWAKTDRYNTHSNRDSTILQIPHGHYSTFSANN